MEKFLVVALYKFIDFPCYQEVRDALLKLCQDSGIRGTLLLAEEGINGTISGEPEMIHAVLDYLKNELGLGEIEYKESFCEKLPFHRMKVRLKKEIVTLGVPNVDPNAKVGEYVDAADWNDLISDPEVTLIDTRNDYEVEMGQFKGAINPYTESFRDFPQYVKENLADKKHGKVAMYCTGGIRCEKATSYLLEQGYDKVYHLKGGILKYLEQVPEEQSLWDGECLVFDDRVSVDHDLSPGTYELCYGCQMPISEEDRKSEHYIPGIQCGRCYDKISDERRASLLERQKQVRLAKKRGEVHVGEPHPPGRAYRPMGE